MTDATDPPITREELLGGLVGRRASTTLYAIERRTAYLAMKGRHAVAPAICEQMVATQERAFLSALGGDRLPEATPGIFDLERFAPGWRHLAPGDADGRAALARRFADSYRFRRRDVPRLATVLGWDEPRVRAAYRERYGAELDDVYARDLGLPDRWRSWRSRAATRVTELSPFWTAFALTLTQTVGAGILALPIAMAGVGPLPGLVILVVLGIVNVLTVAAIAESFARTGSVRWGGAFLGGVVGQYLGRPAAAVLSASLAALSAVALLAYHVGLSAILAAATGVTPLVWTSVLFLVTLAAVARGQLEGTIASALVVGAVNVGVIAVLSALALRHVEAGNLTTASVPLVGGRGFDPAVLGLVFGVALLAYFGHSAVASAAGVVLRRDPSGRALVRGAAAAMVTVIGLYGLWTTAVGGAVPSARLATESGTALEPLAEVVGPVILVAGTVFAVLAMGMAAVVFSVGLSHQAAELLPSAGRFAGVAPLVIVFVLVQGLLVTDRGSFTGALGLVGTLTAPIIIGIVPVLLVVAARRRGEYLPAASARLLRRRPVLVAVYVVFLGALLAHGLVIWTAPLPRAAALLTAAVALAVTASVMRSGALRPAATVELRRDAELDRCRLRVTAGGRRAAVDAEVTLTSGERLPVRVDGAAPLAGRVSAVTVSLADLARDPDVVDLRVWVHEVDASGASRPLAAVASLTGDGGSHPLALEDGTGHAALDDSVGSLSIAIVAGAARLDPGGRAR